MFQPKLQQKPLVIINSANKRLLAYSTEAKKLGVNTQLSTAKLGKLIHKQAIQCRQANQPLYQDMAKRVQTIIQSHYRTASTTINNKSTAKLPIKTTNSWTSTVICLNKRINCIAQAHRLKQEVYKTTGIPISIGIGPTVVLAQIASQLAQRLAKAYVFSLEHPKMQNYWLRQLLLEEFDQLTPDVTHKLCKQYKLSTVQDFKLINKQQLQANFNSDIIKLHQALNGIHWQEITDNHHYALRLEAAKPIPSSIKTQQSKFQQLFTEGQHYQAMAYKSKKTRQSLVKLSAQNTRTDYQFTDSIYQNNKNQKQNHQQNNYYISNNRYPLVQLLSKLKQHLNPHGSNTNYVSTPNHTGCWQELLCVK